MTVFPLKSGKSLAVGFYDFGYGNADYYLKRFNPDGTTDLSFGVDGTVINDLSGTIDYASTAILATQDSIIAAGASRTNASFVKYDLNGNFVKQFGTDGVFLTGIDFWTDAKDLILVNDGFIAVCTTTNSGPNSRYDVTQQAVGLVKFSANGVLDTSFGDNGKFVVKGIQWQTNLTLGYYNLFIEKTSPNDFVVIGTVWQDPAPGGGGPRKFFFKKINNDGTESASYADFNNNLRIIDTPLSADIAATLVDQRGKILIVSTQDIGGVDFAVYSFNDMGVLDTSYGDSGKAVINFGAQDFSQSAAIDSDGSVFVGGITETMGVGFTADLAITKLTTSGQLDETFGVGGKVIIKSFEKVSGSQELNITDIQFTSNKEILVLYTTAAASSLIRLDKSGNVISGYVQGNDGDNAFDGTVSNDYIVGFEGDDSITSGDGNDIVYAGVGDDLIVGGNGKGDDAYYGGDGVDTVKYTSATASISVNLSKSTGTASATNTKVKDAAGIGSDKLFQIENIIAGNFNDIITGSSSANVIRGCAGRDSIDGGAGLDTADYSDKTDSVSVILNGATASISKVNNVDEDSLKNIENLIGGSSNDSLTGDRFANLFIGGLGNDTLDGGAGSDIADYSEQTTSVSVTLNGSTSAYVTFGGTVEDVIRNIENIIGGSGNDSLIGDGLDNVLTGAAGIDTLDGASGIDTANYSEKTTSVSVSLNGSTSVIVKVGGSDEDTISNIENVIGGSSDDTLTGDSQANVLTGGAGNDVMDGDLGKDTLDGGSGIDTIDYSGRDQAIVVTLNGSISVIVKVNNINEDSVKNFENIIGGSGNDILAGDSFANLLSGGAGSDNLKGNAGNDTLDGGGGNDTLIGGSGDDVYLLSYENVGSTSIVEVNKGGIDSIYGDLTTYTLGDNLENYYNDRCIDGNFIDIKGNALNNVISTYSNSTNSSEKFFGLGGNDILLGGLNDDYLSGGLGQDTLTGGSSADKFVFDANLDNRSNVDLITDFVSVQLDKIVLNSAIFSKFSTEIGLTNLRVNTTGVAEDSDDYLVFDSIKRTLFYDADGNGSFAKAVAFATLTGVTTLSTTDFELISSS